MSAAIVAFLFVFVGSIYALKWWAFALWGGIGLLGAMIYAAEEWMN